MECLVSYRCSCNMLGYRLGDRLGEGQMSIIKTVATYGSRNANNAPSLLITPVQLKPHSQAYPFFALRLE